MSGGGSQGSAGMSAESLEGRPGGQKLGVDCRPKRSWEGGRAASG